MNYIFGRAVKPLASHLDVSNKCSILSLIFNFDNIPIVLGGDLKSSRGP